MQCRWHHHTSKGSFILASWHRRTSCPVTSTDRLSAVPICADYLHSTAHVEQTNKRPEYSSTLANHRCISCFQGSYGSLTHILRLLKTPDGRKVSTFENISFQTYILLYSRVFHWWVKTEGKIINTNKETELKRHLLNASSQMECLCFLTVVSNLSLLNSHYNIK